MTTLAAIDCGTNSTRVLISRGSGRRWTTLHRENTITRLGQGVDATGALDPAAIERSLAALRRYREAMDAHGVEAVRITATSAARDAANASDFFDPAEAIVGARPELISGAEEGQLTFAGATAELDPATGPFLVVDIGGGSTELILGTTGVEAVTSLDLGCVRLTERHLHEDPPAPEELSNAISEATDLFIEAFHQFPAMREANVLVGVAGTVSTVTAVELGLAEYDRDAIHHFRLEHAAVEDVFRTLATEALADRLHNPGLEPARGEVIVGGCCVLVSLFRTLGGPAMLVSESDILDGLVFSLAERLDA